MPDQAVAQLHVDWGKPTWWSLFRYHEGWIRRIAFAPKPLAIDRIYQRVGSGQLSVYSAADLDGMRLSVNDGPIVVLRKRGRFGRLYRSVHR